MNNPFKFTSKTRTGYNRGLTYAIVGAIVLHVILIIGIRGFGENREDQFDYYNPFDGEMFILLYPIPPPPPPPPVGNNDNSTEIDSIPEFGIPEQVEHVESDFSGLNSDENPELISGLTQNIKINSSDKPKGDTRFVKLLRKDIPQYPRLARKLGIEGTVVVRVTVGVDGKPKSVELFTSSTSDILDAAAIRAAESCLFIPAMNNGDLVEQNILIYYKFQLKGTETIIK